MGASPKYAGGARPSQEYSFGWNQQKRILASLSGDNDENISQLTDLQGNGGRGSPGRGADVGVVDGRKARP